MKKQILETIGERATYLQIIGLLSDYFQYSSGELDRSQPLATKV